MRPEEAEPSHSVSCVRLLSISPPPSTLHSWLYPPPLPPTPDMSRLSPPHPLSSSTAKIFKEKERGWAGWVGVGGGGCEVCAGPERNSNVKKFRHKDTDGKTFWLTETQTKIHSDWQTHRRKDIYIDRNTDGKRLTDTQTGRHSDWQKHRRKDIQIDRNKDGKKFRLAETQTERYSDGQEHRRADREKRWRINIRADRQKRRLLIYCTNRQTDRQINIY